MPEDERAAPAALPDDDFALAAAPDPDDLALASGETALAPVLRAEIAASGGLITFARFMALALGHPEHGYYARDDLAWGAAGDYETSPEVHPIFGFLWARQVLECWERLGAPSRFDLVEIGAGSGALSAAMLTWLRARAPRCFDAVRPVVLDGHPARVDAQRRTLARRGLAAEHRLLDDWLADPRPVAGVVISNELFDALPVHLVGREGERLREWYVRADGAGFALEPGPPSSEAIAAHLERLGVLPGDGCRAEVGLAAPALMRRVAGRLERGYVVTIDYGHEAEALFAPWRREGTLMAFRRHGPQPDPLAAPGELDLTAHVDLTALARAAVDAGCEVAPTTSQAEALVALGLGDALRAAAARASRDVQRFAEERRAAETLTDPAGLGRIRVLVAGRDASPEGLRCLAPLAPPPR